MLAHNSVVPTKLVGVLAGSDLFLDDGRQPMVLIQQQYVYALPLPEDRYLTHIPHVQVYRRNGY